MDKKTEFSLQELLNHPNFPTHFKKLIYDYEAGRDKMLQEIRTKHNFARLKRTWYDRLVELSFIHIDNIDLIKFIQEYDRIKNKNSNLPSDLRDTIMVLFKETFEKVAVDINNDIVKQQRKIELKARQTGTGNKARLVTKKLESNGTTGKTKATTKTVEKSTENTEKVPATKKSNRRSKGAVD